MIRQDLALLGGVRPGRESGAQPAAGVFSMEGMEVWGDRGDLQGGLGGKKGLLGREGTQRKLDKKI